MRRLHNMGQVFNLPAPKRPVENLPHESPRAGFTLVEIFVSVVVFGTALVTFLPMLHAVGNQQRMTDQRLLALREAENLLEELSAISWNELTSEALASATISEEAKSRLPQAALTATVDEPVQPPLSKRVLVQVNWTSRPGHASQSIQLAAWFFRTEVQP